MTKREFFETIIKSAMADEVKDFAKAEIQKMDEQLISNSAAGKFSQPAGKSWQLQN